MKEVKAFSLRTIPYDILFFLTKQKILKYHAPRDLNFLIAFILLFMAYLALF